MTRARRPQHTLTRCDLRARARGSQRVVATFAYMHARYMIIGLRILPDKLLLDKESELRAQVCKFSSSRKPEKKT